MSFSLLPPAVTCDANIWYPFSLLRKNVAQDHIIDAPIG